MFPAGFPSPAAIPMRKSLLFLLAAATLACAPAGPATAPRRAGGDTPIAAPELAELGHRDALSAVRALRPRWLRAQPQTLSGNDGVVVYLGMLRLGGVQALTDYSTADIGEIRYLRPHQAQLRFGAGHLNGAIVITPRR
jgi:hypothetical protein